MSFELNPYHVEYVTSPPSTELNTLTQFFALLDPLDEFERQRILTPAFLGFVEPCEHPPEATEEQNNEADYKAFKMAVGRLERCTSDYFAVYSTVSFLLCWMRHFADESSVQNCIARFRRLRDLIDADEAKGIKTEEQKQRMKVLIEEHINNARANANLWQQRYYLFCDSVVRHLCGR